MSAEEQFEEGEEEGLVVVVEHARLSPDVARLKSLIAHAVEDQGFRIRYLGLILTDREAVHALNRDYLDHNFPTDVVSFPLDEEALPNRIIDGEVYVDLDTAAERAPEFGASFDEEAARYAIHGVLHLMGYDDAEDEARAAMRRLEDLYLDENAS